MSRECPTKKSGGNMTCYNCNGNYQMNIKNIFLIFYHFFFKFSQFLFSIQKPVTCHVNAHRKNLEPHAIIAMKLVTFQENAQPKNHQVVALNAVKKVTCPGNAPINLTLTMFASAVDNQATIYETAQQAKKARLA